MSLLGAEVIVIKSLTHQYHFLSNSQSWEINARPIHSKSTKTSQLSFVDIQEWKKQNHEPVYNH